MLTLWSLVVVPALAGTVVVQPAPGSQAPYVTRDGANIGGAPIDFEQSGGGVTLGFKAAPFTAIAFEQRVEVPVTGTVVVRVDLAARTATIIAEPVAASTTSAPEAPPPSPTGDLYVSGSVEGAAGPRSVDGATILLDGVDTGLVTPAMLTGIGVGDHIVVLRTECSRAEVKTTIKAGRIARIDDALLKPGTSKLRVATEPRGAVVYLDGTEVGKTPYEAGEATCGEHAIEVRAPGFLAQSARVQARAFETSTWSVDLVKETYGVLTVAVEPLSAVVAVDGITLDAGPQTIDPIATGQHEVRVSAEGFEERVESVQIAPEVVTRIDVQLDARLPEAPRGWGGIGTGPARIGVDATTTAVGLALVALGTAQYVKAGVSYEQFLVVESEEEAARIFNDEVNPARTWAYFGWAAGGAALAGSGVLWATTDFGGGSARIGVSGRW